MPGSRIWIALVGVAAGIHAADHVRVSPPGWAALAVVPFLLLAVRRPRSLAAAGLFLVAFVAGIFDGMLRSGPTIAEHLALRVPTCEIEGRVVEHQGGLGTYLSLDRARCPDELYGGGLGTVVADGIIGDAGGRFKGAARLVPLTRSSFDEARRRQGASASIRSLELSFSPPVTPARRVAARVRRGLVEATSGLDLRRAALLRGLTIGDTEDMDRETTLRFRRSGLTHLVAVSGSNVAIVVGAVIWLLSPGGVYLRTAGAAVALALFVLIVGPEPSVLRAAAMGSIAILAFAAGRRTLPLNTLGIALIVVILLRPGLLSSAGLQLSAGATAGLVLWSGTIAARLRGIPRPLALAAAATLAAQMAVAPLLIVLFGQLSLIAPVANVLAVPAVPAATVLGLASGITATFSSPLGRILARSAEPFAWWILAVGDSTGGASWAAIDLPRGSGWVLGFPVAAAAWATLHKARSAGSSPRPAGTKDSL